MTNPPTRDIPTDAELAEACKRLIRDFERAFEIDHTPGFVKHDAMIVARALLTRLNAERDAEQERQRIKSAAFRQFDRDISGKD